MSTEENNRFYREPAQQPTDTARDAAEPYCGALHEGFECTLPKGHTGWHAAHCVPDGPIVAAWSHWPPVALLDSTAALRREVEEKTAQLAAMTKERDDLQARLEKAAADMAQCRQTLTEVHQAWMRDAGNIAAERDTALARAEAGAEVTNEVLRIMSTYHAQEASPRGVQTPGGLEHMGDVWRLLLSWERKLRAAIDATGGTEG